MRQAQHDVREPARGARRPRPADRRPRRGRARAAAVPAQALRTPIEPASPSSATSHRRSPSPGADNDLNDSLKRLPGGQRAASRSVTPTIKGLDAAQDVVDFAVPYTPDLLGFVSKFGEVTAYYDANGHYARVLPAVGEPLRLQRGHRPARPDPALGQQFDAFPSLGLGPVHPLPGRLDAGQRRLAEPDRPPVPRRRLARRRLRPRRRAPGPMRRIARHRSSCSRRSAAVLVTGAGAGRRRRQLRGARDLRQRRLPGQGRGGPGRRRQGRHDRRRRRHDRRRGRRSRTARPDPGKAVVVMQIDDPGVPGLPRRTPRA